MKRREFLKRISGAAIAAIAAPVAISNGILKDKPKLPDISNKKLTGQLNTLWINGEKVYEGGVVDISEFPCILKGGETVMMNFQFSEPWRKKLIQKNNFSHSVI